jgi:iron complex outermembrane receptor protein
MMNKKIFTWLSVFFCFLCSITAFAQEKIISGKVTDKNTQGGLPSVTVSVKGTTRGTITDFEGNYQINVPDGGKTLVFSVNGLDAGGNPITLTYDSPALVAPIPLRELNVNPNLKQNAGY